ncbi:uncharacterized protein [Montipora foliosa]|uniref:uncharacterized protein n=1 Tax=Montipora foliosa TaxID=591990 RepID=UPI0035F12C08
MAGIPSFLVTLLLVAGVLSRRLENFKDLDRREYRKGKPQMLWERGLIPEYEDDPEVYGDTAWLLDRVIMNDMAILDEPEPPFVIYRFGSGNKQECINGEKTLPPQCQWTGWVVQNSTSTPEQVKLTVAKKYCTQAGFQKPKDKVIPCMME